MMWLKDRLIRNIILGVVGLGLLGGAYYLVLKMPEQTDEQTPTATASPVSGSEAVIEIETEELEKLYIKNDSDEYTLVRDGENWCVEGRNIEYSQSKIKNFLYNFTNFYVSKKIDGGTDEEYGLSNPSAKAVLTKTDGTRYEILLGNEVVGDTGYFTKLDGIIYTVSKTRAEYMKNTANSLRDTALMAIDMQTLKSFKLSDKNGVIASIRHAEESEAEKMSMMTTLVMTEPKYVAVNTDYLNKIIESIVTVNAKSFVCDDRSKFAEYGLDVPNLTFEIADENGSFVINYGKKDENGDVYANMGGTDSVFLQAPTMYDTLSKVDTLSLIEKFCHIINIDDITEVTIEGGGKKYTLSLEGEEDNMKYFCDGKTANEDAFKDAYQAVIGLVSNGFAEKAVSGTPEYTVIFKYKDGSELKNEYISYDERNFVLDKNGVREYIILKKNITAMLDQLESFAADPGKQPE